MRVIIFVLCSLYLTLCNTQVPMQLLDKSLHSGLTTKIGNFSVELLYHTTQSQSRGENLIISPVTVWTVLAVIAEGATDDTLKQIGAAIRVQPKAKDRVKKEYQDLAKWLQVNTTTVELQKFNALFVDKKNGALRDFQEDAKGYDTRMISVNFTESERTSSLMNALINSVTRGRIPTLVSSEDLDNANLLLLSALYFKGQWTVPFNKTFTKVEPFHDSNGVKLGNVNMMYNRYTYPFANIAQLQARVIEIPYGSNNPLSMLIMLPDTGVSLNRMFYNLVNVTLDTIFDELKVAAEQYNEDEVDCYIPRFKIESTLSLTKPLNRMGIFDLFDMRKARLLHMTKLPVHVTKIIHKAEIEVTEEGTAASAVTAAEFGNRISALKFVANRPFCYLIIEKVTNTIAFGGFYHTPSLF